MVGMRVGEGLSDKSAFLGDGEMMKSLYKPYLILINTNKILFSFVQNDQHST